MHPPLKVLWSTWNAEGKFIVAVPSERCNESGSYICSLDFLANGTCNNPLFTSSLENTVAPVNCPMMSSTFSRRWCSLSMHQLSGFRSTQIPFFFTTTMPTHQGVGCCTFDIIPWSAITSNSCFTLSWRGNGMFLAVLSEKGQGSGLTRIS